VKRRRYGRRRSCGRKVRHATQAAAAEHRDALLALGDTGLTVYPCRYCGHLHVGHRSQTR
jgi:rubrerythrin